MCRTGTSGEGMPQDRSLGPKAGHKAGARATLLRAILGIALVGLVVGLDTRMARAADDDTNESAWNKFMHKLGLKGPPDANSDISYIERSPLVVPPSRDLPPPAAGAAAPAPDWPNDPVKPAKHAKGKPAVLPETAVQTPNPPVEKKPWYNPAGWFNKEEYATFAGEPTRENLTDPPAGYRVPSPAQPYGISPDKKPYKPTAQDLMATPITGTQQPSH
jgi:hypothetical protein